MRINLEVFFAKIVDDDVQYRCRLLDISDQSDNPDRFVQDLVDGMGDEVKANRDKTIIHSTSWRCAQCDLISLTYIVYSDYFDLEPQGAGLIPIAELGIAANTNVDQPHPTHLEQRHVVSHGLRHISFLIKNDPTQFEPALMPHALEAFKRVDTVLAGGIS